MAEPQLEKAVTEQSIFDQVTTLAKPPIVRMDRSRDFASVHGERTEGDHHHEVFFYQDSLPFSSQGVLLWQRAEVMANPKLKAKAEKLLKRALKLRMEAPGEDADEDEDDEELDELEQETEEEPLKVNLTEWAAGKDFPWQEVSNAIARRFFKRVNNRRNALELLIEEKVIAAGALSRAHRKLLESE